MSGWRIVTKALHRRGGVATHSRQFDDGAGRTAVARARALGLIEHASRTAPWLLTEKGRAWCEGRLRYEYHGQQTVHRFVPAPGGGV